MINVYIMTASRKSSSLIGGFMQEKQKHALYLKKKTSIYFLKKDNSKHSASIHNMYVLFLRLSTF